MRFFLLFFIMGLFQGRVCAQESLETHASPPLTEAKVLRTPVWSTSRFFFISGGQSVYNARVAERAEDVLEAVEKLAGQSAPRFSDTPLFVDLEDDPAGRGRVTVEQIYRDYALHQRLEYPLGSENREEEMLEAMVWLILNRYTVLSQAQGERAMQLNSVPEWLAVGVAQQISPSSRHRNRTFVKEHYDQPTLFSPPQITAWIKMPEKNVRVRAACDLFFKKLMQEDDEFLSKALRVIGRTGRLDWLDVNTSLMAADLRTQAVRWDVWRAKEALGVRRLGAYTQQDMKEAADLMSFSVPSLRIFLPEGMNAQLSFPQVVELSQQRWADETLKRLRMELFQLGIGKTGEMGEWMDGMQALLSDILATSGEDRGGNSETWRREWMGLERNRQQIMQSWLQVDRYLDQVEQSLESKP